MKATYDDMDERYGEWESGRVAGRWGRHQLTEIPADSSLPTVPVLTSELKELSKKLNFINSNSVNQRH